MSVGISIVCRNRPLVLDATLLALTMNDMQANVIVDNGSDDPRMFELLARYEAIHGTVIIRNRENRGLSVAVNQGLSVLYDQGFEFLTHLDDDAHVNDDCLKKWPALFKASPELGLGLPNADNYVEFLPHPGYRELRWGLGFVWMLRREVYEKIGGYDPQLLHQQECDLALRVRMAGYTVGAIENNFILHNDPGGERSALSVAREHLGCVQFRTKWSQYFRGVDWSYGKAPLYLMQHWPPDQDWLRRYAEHHGIDLNPPPNDMKAEAFMPGATLGLSEKDFNSIPRTIRIGKLTYMAYVDLRNEYSHWYRGDGYIVDQQKAIDRWAELTGEIWTGYKWPNLLKPADVPQEVLA